MNNSYLLNSINVTNIPTIIGYAVCVLFIIIGFIIIIQNKSTKKVLKDEKDTKNSIDKLINKDKKEEPKSFNPDSIFKKLPTFSNKDFFDKTEIDLKNKLELNDIKILKKEIIDFKDEPDKYIITSNFKIKTNDLEEILTITSEKNKQNNNLITNCPTCGGKIKDINILRCKYCDSILPNNKNISHNTWTITDINK